MPAAPPQAEPARRQLTLVYSPSGAAGSHFDLERDAVVFGRGLGADVQLDDPRMSRAHVRVVWDGRARMHRFSDLGSANGTFLNGARTENGVLSDQDVLRAGNSIFVYDNWDRAERLRQDCERVARSTLPVLLLGETGAGKEVLARKLHEASGRNGKFVAVNCAALPRGLAEAELFGHTRAAFTGASEARLGVFRAAEAGTLLLDEIGDLPIDLQPVLLRVLEERTVRAVGADREVPVDVRVVAATHVSLEQLVLRGTFREDLLARLQRLVINVPPLRERRTEILPLLRAFAPTRVISADAAEALLIWEWRRNVRELRALAESMLVLEPDAPELGLRELARRFPEMVGNRTARTEECSSPPHNNRSELDALLKKHDGNVAAVARELKKPRSHVYRWLRAFGIQR